MFGVSRFVQKVASSGLRAAKGKRLDATSNLQPATVIDERTIALGQIWQQVSAQINERDPEDWNLWHWLQDLYYDPSTGSGQASEQLFAITISAGRLYRWPVSVDGDVVSVGEPMAVVVEFTETDDRTKDGGRSQLAPAIVYRPSSTVRRTKDGRWVGCSVLCTATVNKMGILDSRALFDSFVSRFKGDGSEYINLLHLAGGKSRIGTLRHVWRDDKLLVGLYEFTQDDPIAEATACTLAEDADGFWGGSIEFQHFGETVLVEVADGVKLPMTHDGQLFGYSVARNQDCAAWYTGNVVMERTMTEKDRQIALELLGDEGLVDELQQRLGEANRMLDGAITRTVQDTGYGIRNTADSLSDEVVGEEAEPNSTGALRAQILNPGVEPVVYELEPEALDQIAEVVVGHRAIGERFEQVAVGFEQRVDAVLQRIDALTQDLEQRAARLELADRALEGRLGKLEQDDQVRYQQYDLEKPKQPVVKIGVRPRERAQESAVSDAPDVNEESVFARKAREKRAK